MSVELGRYSPLKTAVAMFLDEENKSDGDRDKAWIMAFRAFTVMGFAATWEPLTVKLTVQGNNTAILPADYVMWSKIGVLNGSNEVSTLKINNSITKYKDNNPNRLNYLTPDVPDTDFNNLVLNPYFLNYYFGGWYVPLFGLGSGLIQYGECTVDEKNGVIVLGPQYPFSDVLLEYISCPEKNEDYMIEACLQEAVIAFIKWKFKVGTEQEFYARFKEGRRSLPNKRITLQEIQQNIRSQSGYKVKA